MKMQTIRKRQAQRRRLARSIKHLKATPESQNKKDGLESLLRIAKNYPKIALTTKKINGIN